MFFTKLDLPVNTSVPDLYIDMTALLAHRDSIEAL